MGNDPRDGSCLPPLGGCFAFLDPLLGSRAPRRRRSEGEPLKLPIAKKPEYQGDKQIPRLHEACLEVQGSCRGQLGLAWRRTRVASRLLPVVVSCAADYSRPAGPRRAVANARRLRLALEALGPAFVKLGQAAATREDILSDAVAAELRKLCDQVAPYPDQEAMALICSELGHRAPAEIGDVVAAASLGQVYRVAVDGREYAMKVQRPGLVKAIATDVIILKGVARFMRSILRRLCATAVDPVDIVEAWALTMWDELNYELEARSMEDMRKALSTRVRGLVIPQVNWELTSKRVLTAEWINGVKVTDDPKVVRQEHINVGVETFAAMVLQVGVVHADPHPGNMIITDNGMKLCLLDFGMVIKVPPSHREAWARCIVHLVMKEHEGVLNALIDIGFFPQDCPRDEILPVMSKIWSQLVDCGSDIQKRKAAAILLEKELLTLVRRFRFGLPDYYVALARAFVTLEGIALASGCEFDIFQAIFPVCLRFLATAGASAAAAEARRSGKALLQGLCTKRVATLATAGALVGGFLVWTQIAQQSA